MRTISILKKAITFYYYLVLIGFILVLFVLPFIFGSGNFTSINFIDDADISNLSWGKFVIISVFGACVYFQFLRAIYLFKNSLPDLSTGNYFSELVIANFKKIGKSFLVFGFGQWAFKVFTRFLILKELRLGIDNTLILLSILGLFFLFLSEAFAKANEVKQENDLTI